MTSGQSCVVGDVKRVAHVQCGDSNATNINLSLSSPSFNTRTDYALSTTRARYQQTNTHPSGTHIRSFNFHSWRSVNAARIHLFLTMPSPTRSSQ